MSEQSKRVDLLEWEFSKPSFTVEPSQWPPEHRWMIVAFLADQDRWTKNDQSNIGKGNRSLRFFVAVGRDIRAIAVGINGWKFEIVPALRGIVGA